MLREIVKIDEEKCIGCGLCTSACQEGALQLIDGKAKLLSDAYCDGLGICLPNCPVGAITIERRTAVAFNKEVAPKHLAGKSELARPVNPGAGCPGSRAMVIDRKEKSNQVRQSTQIAKSQLGQWPCQIKLVPVNAPYFDNAHLLIAADCTAFAYANIHNDFMRDKITIIGCPKLEAHCIIKLNQIKIHNGFASVLRLNRLKSSQHRKEIHYGIY